MNKTLYASTYTIGHWAWLFKNIIFKTIEDNVCSVQLIMSNLSCEHYCLRQLISESAPQLRHNGI